MLDVSSTNMRKISATKLAETESDSTVKLVTHHMSNDYNTTKRYYQHLDSSKNSLKAFEALNETATATSTETQEQESDPLHQPPPESGPVQ